MTQYEVEAEPQVGPERGQQLDKGPGGGSQCAQLTDGSTLVLPDLLIPAAPGKLIWVGGGSVSG